MAKRNKQNIDLIWLHMDTTHLLYAPAILAMRAQHESEGDFKLSINLKDDGLESLVKVAGVLTPFVLGQPWLGAVLRVFTEADHNEAVTLVRDPIWEPPLA